MKYIVAIVFFFISCSAFSQRSISQQTPTLEDARIIAVSDPQKAIEIINGILNKRSKTRKVSASTRAEAHELLGDINVNIELYEQATTRYEQALKASNSLNNNDLTRRLNRKTAETYLLIDPFKSIDYFNRCISTTSKKGDDNACLEGKADAFIAVDSVQKGIDILQKLELEFRKENNSSLARIQAKIANGFAKIDLIDKAVLNYSNAQKNYESPSAKDDQVFQNSTNNITIKQSANDQIQLRNSNINVYNTRPAKVAEEKLELVELYVKSGKNNTALAKLNEIKPIIGSLPVKTQADYFKKSSEIYALQGNYEKALRSYENFQKSNNIILQSKEKLLDKKIIINELQKNLDIDEKETENIADRSYYKENMVQRQQWIIGLMACLLIGSLLSFFVIYRNIRSKQRANALLELRSLRSEMNPHFIFNALGSVNNFIAEKDGRRANKYLADFSKLMRAAMEMNKHDLIPLREELEFSIMYLALEHKRWEDKFDTSVNIAWDNVPEDIQVPPLLIQPYIENAVWHGLRYTKSMGKLSISVLTSHDEVKIVILDDGIGRKKSLELKTTNQLKYKSTGLQNTKKRTSLINTIYQKSYQITITDNPYATDERGTMVTILLRK